MTRDINQFSHLALKAKGFVTYGDNNKGRILGKGKVGAPPFTSIEDVLYVEGLKHNLLSISQLCDKGFNNIFMISLDDPSLKVKCLMANNDDS